MESMTLDSILVKNVLLKKGENYVLVKVAREITSQASGGGFSFSFVAQLNPWGFAMRILPEGQASTVSGIVTDETGTLLANTNVHLGKNGDVVIETQTSSQGNYKFVLYPTAGIYDLAAEIGTLGVWKLGIKVNKGQNYNFDLISTLAFFSAEANATGGLDNLHGWPSASLINEAHSHGTDVVLCVTLFSNSSTLFVCVTYP